MGGARDQRAGSKTPDNWPENLDIDALLATGWRPTPFQEFVLKVHGRCDLACDYCYVYRSADQRWRTQPRIMSLTVAARAAARIAEHAERHRLTHVRVVLHGGEPLLRTPHDLAQIIELIRRATGDLAHVEMTVQTNGMRLHEPYLQLFKRNDVRVGVSLDGDATAHNRHRRTPNGGGSHDLVAAGIRRLISPSYRHLFGGLLCVIDPRTDATSVYKGLLEYDPPMVDFLLPHGHWSVPPPGRVQGDPATPYADWLIEIFELWYGEPERP
ncbi:radical SAM protein [Nonomuraea thailandensis]